MTNSELLTALSNDLANVNAPKQAHIQIERILGAYQKQAEAKKEAEEKKNKTKEK